MNRNPAAYLWDAIEAAGSIESFTHALDEDAYLANSLVQAAVERKFEIIGEALNQLAKVRPDLAKQIKNLGQIVAFRNVLIHGYASVDSRRVWRTVITLLPEIKLTLTRLMVELQSQMK
jgi:uncharacterized protein with HEPN domain